jgi:general secretion pathway protein E/type IV pilus assembly protein PilB
MAQRLVRVLCPACKKAYEPRKDKIPSDFPFAKLEECGGRLYEPVGCRQCRQLGYQGRQGIFELLLTSDKIRKLAHERKGTWDIKQVALAEGMRTLRQDGWRRVLLGETTVDEVMRVSKAD